MTLAALVLLLAIKGWMCLRLFGFACAVGRETINTRVTRYGREGHHGVDSVVVDCSSWLYSESTLDLIPWILIYMLADLCSYTIQHLLQRLLGAKWIFIIVISLRFQLGRCTPLSVGLYLDQSHLLSFVVVFRIYLMHVSAQVVQMEVQFSHLIGIRYCLLGGSLTFQVARGGWSLRAIGLHFYRVHHVLIALLIGVCYILCFASWYSNCFSTSHARIWTGIARFARFLWLFLTESCVAAVMFHLNRSRLGLLAASTIGLVIIVNIPWNWLIRQVQLLDLIIVIVQHCSTRLDWKFGPLRRHLKQPVLLDGWPRDVLCADHSTLFLQNDGRMRLFFFSPLLAQLPLSLLEPARWTPDLPALHGLVDFFIVLEVKFSWFAIYISVYGNDRSIAVHAVIYALHWLDGCLWLRGTQTSYLQHTLLRCRWLTESGVVWSRAPVTVSKWSVHRPMLIVAGIWVLVLESGRFRLIWMYQIISIIAIIVKHGLTTRSFAISSLSIKVNIKSCSHIHLLLWIDIDWIVNDLLILQQNGLALARCQLSSIAGRNAHSLAPVSSLRCHHHLLMSGSSGILCTTSYSLQHLQRRCSGYFKFLLFRFNFIHLNLQKLLLCINLRFKIFNLWSHKFSSILFHLFLLLLCFHWFWWWLFLIFLLRFESFLLSFFFILCFPLGFRSLPHSRLSSFSARLLLNLHPSQSGRRLEELLPFKGLTLLFEITLLWWFLCFLLFSLLLLILDHFLILLLKLLCLLLQLLVQLLAVMLHDYLHGQSAGYHVAKASHPHLSLLVWRCAENVEPVYCHHVKCMRPAFGQAHVGQILPCQVAVLYRSEGYYLQLWIFHISHIAGHLGLDFFIMLNENIGWRKINYEVALRIYAHLEDLDLFHKLLQMTFHFVFQELWMLILCSMPAPQLLVSLLDFFLILCGPAELLLQRLGIIQRRIFHWCCRWRASLIGFDLHFILHFPFGWFVRWYHWHPLTLIDFIVFWFVNFHVLLRFRYLILYLFFPIIFS